MKKVTRMLLSAAVAATLAAPAFAAENSYPADTSTPRAVVGPSLHQWKALATVEASALAKKLGTESGPWQVKLTDRAGSRFADDSRFAQSFSTMLVSELSARGVQLTNRATDSVIEVQVETLNHFYDKRSYVPGSLTTLAAGVWLVKGLTEIASGPVVATALIVGEDVLRTHAKDSPDSPAGELGVTLVAAKAGILAASSTNVYLVNHQGSEAYADQPGRTLKFIK